MPIVLLGGDMPRLFVGEAEHGTLRDSLARAIGIEIVGVGRTGHEVSAAIRGSAADIVVFPVEWMEIARSIRATLDPSPIDPARHTAPALALASATPSVALRLKSHLYGLDGVVDDSASPTEMGQQLEALVTGAEHISRDPLVAELGLEHGLLARTLTISTIEDRDIADLVGGGLTDDEIADLLAIPLQRVRNRIETLITSNGLAYRTQLAILVTSLVKVPDFS